MRRCRSDRDGAQRPEGRSGRLGGRREKATEGAAEAHWPPHERPRRTARAPPPIRPAGPREPVRRSVAAPRRGKRGTEPRPAGPPRPERPSRRPARGPSSGPATDGDLQARAPGGALQAAFELGPMPRPRSAPGPAPTPTGTDPPAVSIAAFERSPPFSDRRAGRSSPGGAGPPRANAVGAGRPHRPRRGSGRRAARRR